MLCIFGCSSYTWTVFFAISTWWCGSMISNQISVYHPVFFYSKPLSRRSWVVWYFAVGDVLYPWLAQFIFRHGLEFAWDLQTRHDMVLTLVGTMAGPDSILDPPKYQNIPLLSNVASLLPDNSTLYLCGLTTTCLKSWNNRYWSLSLYLLSWTLK